MPPAAIAISKIVMEKTAKEQIRSGLRVGTGLGGFLIAVMLIGNGLARIGISTASHQLIWTEPVGWMELLIAALILLFTARIWLMLLSGCLLFGIVKSLVVFATGRFPSPVPVVGPVLCHRHPPQCCCRRPLCRQPLIQAA